MRLFSTAMTGGSVIADADDSLRPSGRGISEPLPSACDAADRWR